MFLHTLFKIRGKLLRLDRIRILNTVPDLATLIITDPFQILIRNPGQQKTKK
jgi:hypothetical protein